MVAEEQYGPCACEDDDQYNCWAFRYNLGIVTKDDDRFRILVCELIKENAQLEKEK